MDEASLRCSGPVLREGDDGYETARRIWNGAIDRRPELIVQVQDGDDVVAALRMARERGLPLAVRGGGHNVAGTAICEGGVVIDFSGMRRVSVDLERRVARVQPGALWGDCDAATQPHGLVIPGGIVTHTGVAGLTLGGGIGWAMRQYGLTSDNLRSAHMVLADGSRVQTGVNEEAELFWGIRGGGGNFGILTEFEFDLRAAGPEILAGPILHPAAKAGEVLRFYRDFIARAPDELTIFVNLRTAPELPWVPPHLVGSDVVMLIACWLGDLEEGERTLAPLRAFGPPAADLVRRKPYAEHQSMFDSGVPHGWGYYWKSHYLPPLSDALIDVLVEHAWRKRSPCSYTLIFHMGGAVSRLPDDHSAFEGRSAAHAVNINAAWSDVSAGPMDVAWVREFWEVLRPHATGGVYVNFLSDQSDDLIRAVYGPKLERLAQLKSRVDPDNVFRINQNIRPASSA